nr:cysteine-rich receptor-like protein kinase 25 [Ipomoea batatas]
MFYPFKLCSPLGFMLCLCLLISLFTGATSQLAIYCPNTTATYTPNSTYRSNLNSLLSALSSNGTRENGFYSAAVGSGVDNTVYGLFMCRGDVSTADCSGCVRNATTDILQQCPNKKTAFSWYDFCMLRYSNEPISRRVDQSSLMFSLYNIQNDSQPGPFMESVRSTLDELVTGVLGDRSGKKFAIQETNFSALERIYSLGQCTPDLSGLDCQTCLSSSIQQLQIPSLGARTITPDCNIRYETYSFYNSTAASAPPPPPSVPIRRNSGNSSSTVIIAIVVPIVVGIILFIAIFCFVRAKKAKKQITTTEQTG